MEPAEDKGSGCKRAQEPSPDANRNLMSHVVEQPKVDNTAPLLLVLANLLGIGIGYAITVTLARQFSTREFEQYVGTIATLGLFASLAEAGFGKYGLKVVPLFVANNLRSLLHGYMRFSFLGCLLLSFLLGATLLAIETPLRETGGERTVMIAVLFLPAAACLGVAIDLLIAYQLATTATLIARVLVPTTTLVMLFVLMSMWHVTPRLAVACFGIGSTLGLIIALGFCVFKTIPLIQNSVSESHLSDWCYQGFSFLVFGFLTSWIFKAPLILVHHIPHRVNELALLAPAFESGCLILLISKSTDKYFQPTMSVIIESGDWTAGQTVRRSRYWLVGSGVALYLGLIFVFGKKILGMYGDAFTEAYPALCIIAVGSSCWTLFSLAPSFLMFVGERRKLMFNLLAHGVLLVGLTVLLFLRYGYNGAAMAYAVSISSLALVNVYLADAYIRREGTALRPR